MRNGSLVCVLSVMALLAGAPLLATSCTGEVNAGPAYTENLGADGVAATGVGGSTTTAVVTSNVVVTSSAASSTTGGATTGCPLGLTSCAGACFDVLSDPTNCGGCGVVCGAGQVCSGGVCASGCADPTQTVCGQSCVDLTSNPQNCGACGSTCIAQSCYQSVCQCQPGMTQCGLTCANLQSDPANCGGCGIACVGGSCSLGVCVAGTTATAVTGSVGGTTAVTNTVTTGTFGGVTSTTATTGFGSVTTASASTVSTSATTSTSTTGGSSVTFAQVAAIIDQSCGSSDCHGGAENPTLINDASLYDTLLSDVVRECGNNAFVTPGNPAASAMLMLVTGECSPLIMPEDCESLPCWSATDIQTVTTWILAGAPNN